MQKLKTGTLFLAGAFALVFASCTKNFSSESADQSGLSASTSQSLKASDPKPYLILAKTTAISDNLIKTIESLGTITTSMPELGVVLANSADPGFVSKLKGLDEVQNVLPDLKIRWLHGTEVTGDLDSVVAESDIREALQEGVEQPSQEATLYTSAGLGLSGTNPFVPWQWSLQAVNAAGAFKAGYKGSGARVAVLDASFHQSAPDLVPNIIGAVSFVPGEPVEASNPNGFSHGTHVAGIIAAADNNIGISGVAPASKLLLVKVLNDKGSGQFGWMIQGIYYAANQGVNIINLSLGAMISRSGGKYVDDGGTPDDPSDDKVVSYTSDVQDLITAMNRAFKYASNKGAISIAAAGNEATYIGTQGQISHYPSGCSGVIAVSATGPLDWVFDPNASFYTPATFTNYGASHIVFAGPGGNIKSPPTTTRVQFGAPSIGYLTAPAYAFDMVLSTFNTGGYGWGAGTSQATPAVSGVAALIAGKYNGKISQSQLISKLKASAVDMGAPLRDDYYGLGYVNAGNAVKQ